MSGEIRVNGVDRWFGRNGFTEDQVRQIARLNAYVGRYTEARIRSMVEENSMSPACALEEIRRKLREEGEIPLNREV